MTASVSAGLKSPHRMDPHSPKTSSLVRPVHSWYIVSKFVASGRSGLPNSRPSNASVLHRLIFLAISSGVSSTLILLPSAGLDFDIFAEPSVRDMTLAPASGMYASGTRRISPPLNRPDGAREPFGPIFFHLPPPYKLLTRPAMSRVSSRCCRWSSPTGTMSALYSKMSLAMSTG